MKHLKQKLMAAAAMLAVSAVMLTSASYAWFTISVTPEVKTVTTTVQANENFEIALGTIDGKAPLETTIKDGTLTDPVKKDQTWGATVTSLTALNGMGPAQLKDGVISSAIYGEDGRPAGLDPVTDGTIADGVATITDDQGRVMGQKILLWLRSNVGGAVKVDVTGVDFDTEEDTNKVEVAFKLGTAGTITSAAVTNGTGAIENLGSIQADTATPVYVYIFLDGEAVHNSDMEAQFNVVVESIEFSIEAVDGADSYKHEVLNTGGNTQATITQ